MDRRKLQLSLIFAIILVAYNIVLFLVTKVLYTSFWVSYIFIMLSLLFVIISFFFVSSENRKKQVVGMPVTVLSVLYFCAEFILGTIFMFFNLEFSAVFVPQFVLFVLFALCFVPAILSPKNYKKENTEKQLSNTDAINSAENKNTANEEKVEEDKK